MFIERRLNATTNKVELWKCEWVNNAGEKAKKKYIEKYGDENSVDKAENEAFSESSAICWSYGRTIGNIAVYNQTILGSFNAKSGEDAVLQCDIVESGKFRHGADRWYCRTHQCYWGTKADQESFANYGKMVCSDHDRPMHYQVAPYQLDMSSHAEVGLWCSMPPAMSTKPIQKRHPKIHVHVREHADGKKVIDRDFNALSVKYNSSTHLFGNDEISYVNITPPSAFEFVDALETDREMGHINCKKCGYPHLDLADFGVTPHKKHFCGNCGFDSTWSSQPIVSTPLKPLHDQFLHTWKFVDPNRVLNLDEYKGLDYVVWASTPAIIWTAERPQEKGIHVHVQDGMYRVVDDTFSKVILDGAELDRGELLERMKVNTVV